MGIASVVHALESEMLRREWQTPAPLHEGLNPNPLHRALDAVSLQDPSSPDSDADVHSPSMYRGISAASIGTIIFFTLWLLWQQWWPGAEGRIVVLPAAAYTALVDQTRKELEADSGRMADIRLSTGDILTAWFFKVIEF